MLTAPASIHVEKFTRCTTERLHLTLSAVIKGGFLKIFVDEQEK